MAARIGRILAAVRARKLTPRAALEQIAHLPHEDAGFARLDHQRSLRLGHPEAIFCPGKELPQVVELLARMERAGSVALATRVPPAWAASLKESLPRGRWYDRAGIFALYPKGWRAPRGRAKLAVVSAGTADQRVAEEAAVTAEAHGLKAARLYDVGVAGLHRLLAHTDLLRGVSVVVVVAGMDGALPSVVGGLIGAPVIAVPTSVGYGAHFGGIAPLLTMLNSCAPGVVTVNIDNGYGAAIAAARILRS